MIAKLFNQNINFEQWLLYEDDQEKYGDRKIYTIYYGNAYGPPGTSFNGNFINVIIELDQKNPEKSIDRFKKLYILK